MNFDISDEQKMLAEQARGLLGEHSSFARLRALIDSRAEWDEPLWRLLGEMGFLGANIPEAYGGVGLSELDLGVISQELGRANACTPWFSSIVLAADAVMLAGTEVQKHEWLPRLASGEAVGCFAASEGPGPMFGAATKFEDGRLSGMKSPVIDGGTAEVAVVQAGDGLVLLRLDQPGVVRRQLESFDQLRPCYRLEFDYAAAEALPGANRETIARLFDRAAVQAGFEAAGGAEACLYMARDYAMDRQIFGRSLASFQAIKHKLADVCVAIEMARSNAFFAGWAARHAPERLPGATAAARLTAIAAFEMAARENLQVHGGIGYTFEANCHFFYRRERAHAIVLGSRSYWTDRLMAHRERGD